MLSLKILSSNIPIFYQISKSDRAKRRTYFKLALRELILIGAIRRLNHSELHDSYQNHDITLFKMLNKITLFTCSS